MLKIRDDVDLKELEKYGFLLNSKCQYVKTIEESNSNCEFGEIYIDVIDRKINLLVYSYMEESNLETYKIDTLYDLIKDGLVIKEEK